MANSSAAVVDSCLGSGGISGRSSRGGHAGLAELGCEFHALVGLFAAAGFGAADLRALFVADELQDAERRAVTDAVLRELGLSEVQVAGLRRRGIVA